MIDVLQIDNTHITIAIEWSHIPCRCIGQFLSLAFMAFPKQMESQGEVKKKHL